MVLLTMTPTIVEGLRNVNSHENTTTPTTGNAQGDVTASAQGSTTDPDTRGNEAQDSQKEHKTYSEHTPEVQVTSQQGLSSEPSLQDPKPGNPISHLQLINLSRQLKSTNATPNNLEALLRGSHVYIPPPPPKPEQTPEYKALMARLRRDAEEREYVRLTKTAPASERYSRNLPATSPAFAFASTEAYIEPSPDDEITYDDINRQLTLILNVLISIIACSAALWMVSKWWSTPARLALSMGGSIVVAVAEVSVYFGYIRKIKESVKDEQAVKEVKELVNTWVVNSGEESMHKEEAMLLEDKESETVRRRTKVTTKN